MININPVALKLSSADRNMTPTTSVNYRHQIIRWNGSCHQAAKYQLQVIELCESGKTTHRANWNFETFRGLMTFVEKHFPDCDVLNQAAIQFRVLPALQDS